jgi:hypothetical protein
MADTWSSKSPAPYFNFPRSLNLSCSLLLDRPSCSDQRENGSHGILVARPYGLRFVPSRTSFVLYFYCRLSSVICFSKYKWTVSELFSNELLELACTASSSRLCLPSWTGGDRLTGIHWSPVGPHAGEALSLPRHVPAYPHRATFLDQERHPSGFPFQRGAQRALVASVTASHDIWATRQGKARAAACAFSLRTLHGSLLTMTRGVGEQLIMSHVVH